MMWNEKGECGVRGMYSAKLASIALDKSRRLLAFFPLQGKSLTLTLFICFSLAYGDKTTSNYPRPPGMQNNDDPIVYASSCCEWDACKPNCFCCKDPDMQDCNVMQKDFFNSFKVQTDLIGLMEDVSFTMYTNTQVYGKICLKSLDFEYDHYAAAQNRWGSFIITLSKGLIDVEATVIGQQVNSMCNPFKSFDLDYFLGPLESLFVSIHFSDVSLQTQYPVGAHLKIR